MIARRKKGGAQGETFVRSKGERVNVRRGMSPVKMRRYDAVVEVKKRCSLGRREGGGGLMAGKSRSLCHSPKGKGLYMGERHRLLQGLVIGKEIHPWF